MLSGTATSIDSSVLLSLSSTRMSRQHLGIINSVLVPRRAAGQEHILIHTNTFI